MPPTMARPRAPLFGTRSAVVPSMVGQNKVNTHGEDGGGQVAHPLAMLSRVETDRCKHGGEKEHAGRESL